MDTLDYLLLKRPIHLDDQSMSFERAVSRVSSSIICFLPWRVPLPLARSFGLIPSSFLACYELPNALVGSVPERCVEALMVLVGDALGLLNRYKIERPVIVGLSAGTAPATILADLTGGRLCSVGSADRGDLMLWESPAAVEIKARAIARGYTLRDYYERFDGLNPIDNLRNIRRDSIFAVSNQDPFIPAPRTQALVDRVRKQVPSASIVRSSGGHVRTLRKTIRLLPELLFRSTGSPDVSRPATQSQR